MSFVWVDSALKMAQVMITDGGSFAEAVSDIFGNINVDEKYADIGGIMNIMAEGKFDDIING